jgi:hypothetical protein
MDAIVSNCTLQLNEHKETGKFTLKMGFKHHIIIAEDKGSENI